MQHINDIEAEALHRYVVHMLTREPLKFLERILHLDVYYSKRRTHIVLDGLNALTKKKQHQAWWVIITYKKLLQVQLDSPKRKMRPSVRKMLAQGKLKFVNRGYRVKVKLCFKSRLKR